jgi:prepilin signal peptidase PulO-like enzyme (type II secretory pathway)
MQYVSAILTTLLVMAGYFGILHVLNKRYELNLKRQGKYITDKATLIVGVVTLITTGVLAYVRLPQFQIPQYLLTVFFLCGMGCLTVTDIKVHLIPNRVLMVLFLLWIAVEGVYLITEIENGFSLLCRSLVGAFIGGIIFFLCYLLSKGQLGAGDVKLAFIMGLFLTGERIIGAIFYGTVLCCFFSIVQLIRKKLTLKDGVPLVPFMYMGVLVTLFIM